MATKDHFIIHGPEDYKLHCHTSPEGHIWFDAKNNTIPLNSQLVGHIELIDPNTYWQSRATWTNVLQSSFACFSGCAYCVVRHWGILRECTLGLYRVLHSISINIRIKYLLVLHKLIPLLSVSKLVTSAL